jgi:hypothetical protein
MEAQPARTVTKRARAPPTCSLCHVLGHTYKRCPTAKVENVLLTTRKNEDELLAQRRVIIGRVSLKVASQRTNQFVQWQ